MKLSKKQKKFIDKNMNSMDMEKLAKKLKLEKEDISKYVDKKTKKPFNNKNINLTGFSDLAEFYKANLDVIILLIFLVVFVYINSIFGEFVSDDLPTIVRNPIIQSFSESFKPGHFYAVVAFTFFKLFGQNPTPFHIYSIFIHTINVLLVLPILASLFKNKIALLAVFLFAVHPVNSEVVNWISAQIYVMAMLCFLLCVLTYVFYRNSGNIKYLIGSFLIYALFYLALLNPILLVIPLLMTVIEVMFISKNIDIKLLIKNVLPVYIIGGGYFFASRFILIDRLSQDWAQNSNVNLWQSVPYSMYSALKLLVFPKGLTLYHEGEVLHNAGFVYMGIITLIFLGLIAFTWFKYKNYKITGLLIFIPVSIAPVFSPVQVAWFVADRYLYFATIAFAVLVATGFDYLEKKTDLAKLAYILTTILVLIYSVRTVVRNNDWRTRRTLWESTARVSPFSSRVYNNLGDVYAIDGDLERSVAAFKQAIALDIKYAQDNGGYYQVAPDAMHNIGNTLIQFGKWEEAEPWFIESLKINPKLYQSYYKLGLIEYQREEFQKAAEYFKQAYSISPEFISAKEAYEHVVNEKL